MGGQCEKLSFARSEINREIRYETTCDTTAGLPRATSGAPPATSSRRRRTGPPCRAAARRSLDLHPLGDWADDTRNLVVFPQDAYPARAGRVGLARSLRTWCSAPSLVSGLECRGCAARRSGGGVSSPRQGWCRRHIRLSFSRSPRGLSTSLSAPCRACRRCPVRFTPLHSAFCFAHPRCVESGLPLPAARGRRAMWPSGAAWSDFDGERAQGDDLIWRGRRHCSHDHPCVLPGTSAPRSTSSRSVTLTVLPFGFTSHQ